MRFAAPILAIILATSAPLRAEPANFAVAKAGSAGAATRLVLAQKTYEVAMAKGDAVMLLVAIRLSRTVTLRPPTGWTLSTAGEVATDQPTGRTGAPDPAAPQVLAIVQALAGEDPSLQDLVYDLDAQLPHGRPATAIEARSDLGGGQTDTWRIALSGLTPAELGLIGDGDGPLGLGVTDDSGNIICQFPPSHAPGLCRFVPARNGFFSVTVTNPESIQNSYRLIGG
jgi:hypothetical protein